MTSWVLTADLETSQNLEETWQSEKSGMGISSFQRKKLS